MKDMSQTRQIRLADQELYSFQMPYSNLLQVQSGRVWLTVEGDAQDYWIGAGEQMQLPRGRKVVMEAAKGPARLVLTPLNSHFAQALPSPAAGFLKVAA